jgi:diguanylate cyclase (GGDEF)-like protein
VPGKLLRQVIGQNEHIQELVKRSAEQLSLANSAFKQEFSNGDPLPGMDDVRDKLATAARQLQYAADNLRAVNQSLHVEMRDRAMVDHQLAAAVEQEESSRHAALHDLLTGLPNRMLLRDRLEHGIAQAKRHRWILAVMFVDLDDFKQINDTFGHPVGDAVLQSVAMRLAHTTRNDDTVSRYGGDEFLYLLTPLYERNDINIIAAKIREAIQAPCGVRVGDDIVELRVEASIGISVFPQDGDTAAGLIASADDAMYAAKENKCGVAFAHENVAPGAITHRPGRGRELISADAATPRLLDSKSRGRNHVL